MDNPLAQSNPWLSRLTLMLIAVMLVISLGILGVYWQRASNPYAYQVLSLDGDSQNGLAIFQINCAGCHNLRAENNVGPRLENIFKRKSKRDIITQVTSGRTPPMPKFQASKQEMADLLSYLKTL